MLDLNLLSHVSSSVLEYVQADEYEEAFKTLRMLPAMALELFKKVLENSEKFEKVNPSLLLISNTSFELVSTILKTAIQKGRIDEAYELLRNEVMLEDNGIANHGTFTYLVDARLEQLYRYNVDQGQFNVALDLLKYVKDEERLKMEFDIKLDCENQVM
jgi:hypothetical protein